MQSHCRRRKNRSARPMAGRYSRQPVSGGPHSGPDRIARQVRGAPARRSPPASNGAWAEPGPASSGFFALPPSPCSMDLLGWWNRAAADPAPASLAQSAEEEERRPRGSDSFRGVTAGRSESRQPESSGPHSGLDRLRFARPDWGAPARRRQCHTPRRGPSWHSESLCVPCGASHPCVQWRLG